jgi:adenine-specific DNA-methyltransferase
MKNEYQKVEQAKGRPLLQWVGKKPLESVQFYPAQETEVYGDKSAKDFNKLFWGDNLQVLSHLLKNNRGAINLIYIDPPFGTGVDYFKKIKIRGEVIAGSYNIFEEKQYVNVFEIDYFLQFMYERLLLMRELLADDGNIFIRFDYHFSHYIKVIADEIFGEDNFINEIVIKRSRNEAGSSNKLETSTETIIVYRKTEKAFLNKIQVKRSLANVQWTDFTMAGDRNPPQRTFFGMVIYPAKGQHFSLVQEKVDRIMRENYLRLKCKDCGAYYYYAVSEADLHKRMKNQKNRFKFYDITNDTKMFAVETVEKCLSCGEKNFKVEYLGSEDVTIGNNWMDIPSYSSTTGYPTENSEQLLERVIQIGSNEGDTVADFFMGSGATQAVAQKLGRKWIGCDININSIQTATKRINQIITDQQKTKDFKGSLGFKILNVNDYDVFKNEIEAKEIVMEMYGVEPVKRTYFDGVLDRDFVKVMSLNRVLNKMDIRTLIKSVGDKLDGFTVKTKSKAGEAVYEESVLVICSGMELDVMDFIKKENKTGVKIEVRDILTDKKNLIFKKKPEAKIDVKAKDKKLSVELKDFFSPILMRKLEIENEKVLKKDHKARVEDFKQIIDSVAIDVDYNGKLFNAEVMDLPDKKEVIKAKYSWEYTKKGKYTVAIKVVDVLGEEYFETFEVNA